MANITMSGASTKAIIVPTPRDISNEIKDNFGFVQLFTYVFGVAIPNKLWGEAWENLFYFVTMLYGIYAWIKLYNKKIDNDSAEVEAKKLGVLGWCLTMGHW